MLPYSLLEIAGKVGGLVDWRVTTLGMIVKEDTAIKNFWNDARGKDQWRMEIKEGNGY